MRPNVIFIGVLVLAAVAVSVVLLTGGGEESAAPPLETNAAVTTDGSVAVPSGGAIPAERVLPGDVPDPFREGEAPPSGYRQLLGRDAIRPVYDPVFVTAGEIDWNGDDLVLGVEIDGDARAYSIAFLNQREMVIDRIAGIPVLVTW